MNSKVYAAGVLIQKDRLILAAKRKDSELFGFPGGKIDPEEKASYAAIRECFEETGFVTFLYLPSAYAGIDDSDNVVKIYRAEIVCKGPEPAENEAGYCWVSPKVIATQTPWPDFNQAVLAHFGIHWEN